MKLVSFFWLLEACDGFGVTIAQERALSVGEAREAYDRLHYIGQIQIALSRQIWVLNDRGLREAYHQYAYFKPNGKLPKMFFKGTPVPEKYRRIKISDITG